MNDLTDILGRIEAGDPSAINQLLSVVYEELHQLAVAKMAREAADHTLQPTALVHEAYIRLVGSGEPVSWENRKHFFAAAAEAMRRVLVDAARKRARVKRGGGRAKVNLDPDELPLLAPDSELLALHEALHHLEEKEPRKAELVKLRFFAGLTIEQTAEVLGISTSTADRHWSYARAWLFREVSRHADESKN